MIKKEIMVNNHSGLESKPAALFIQKSSSYKSNIMLEKGDRKANAKSLLGVLSLSIASGTKIILVIDGEDEERAATELEQFLSSNIEESL